MDSRREVTDAIVNTGPAGVGQLVDTANSSKRKREQNQREKEAREREAREKAEKEAREKAEKEAREAAAGVRPPTKHSELVMI
jgi:hypothetical protein